MVWLVLCAGCEAAFFILWHNLIKLKLPSASNQKPRTTIQFQFQSHHSFCTKKYKYPRLCPQLTFFFFFLSLIINQSIEFTLTNTPHFYTHTYS